MTTFFIGCMHFDHEKIIELANRPFGSIDDMNKTMTLNWNRVVKPEDTVYVLGDMCFDKKRRVERMSALNGRKILILGNHDKGLGPWEGLNGFLNGGFSAIHNYLAITLEGTEFVLFHYPIEDWDGRYRGSIHLHAHTHSNKLERPHQPFVYNDDGLLDRPKNYPPDLLCNRFCVGAEAVDYTPISLEAILSKSKGR